MRKTGLYFLIEGIDAARERRCSYCQPKKKNGDVQDTIRSIGKVFDVADEFGKVHSEARLADAFVTTFCNPDSRLLSSYGFGHDPDGLRRQY